ncbi:hypothetical protein P691DRAFT_803953 [Macrolepiota fuliginosa MF-IS2]|uniref:Uncharacterized protein n=1 Tax=Macrolepiota fuliginosa MF-IS2 TaxID=1400762 RepID=A0A9P5X884_9AGAR|nr:hypothetical protein P691DRAFT_803953 [Macrolepiota fuliginosa MF-IS2]
MSFALDVFPAEVWLRIIRVACADTSFTARTLSLVSRDIYHLSKPYRVQSVALLGIQRIFSFYKALTSTTPHNYRRVVHLFIGCPSLRLEHERLKGSSHDNAQVLAIAQELTSSAQNNSNNPLTAIDENTLGRCVQRILSLVADTLKTLHLHFIGFINIDLLPPDRLPFLQQLVLYGAYAPYQIRRDTALHLPALTSLRVGHHNSIPSRIISKLGVLFPTLVHFSLVQSMISTVHFNDLLDMINKLDTVWPEHGGPNSVGGGGVVVSRRLVLEVDTMERLFGNASNWYDQLVRVVATTHRVEIVRRESGWTDLQKAETEWVGETRKWVEEDWSIDSL